MSPFLVLALLTIVSCVPGTYFSAVEFRRPDGEVRRVAGFLLARSAALGLAAVAALVLGSRGWLVAIASTMVVIQLTDAVLTAMNRPPRTPLLGAQLLTAVILAVAMGWLLSDGHGFAAG